jgi:hypothetical protein
MMPMRSCVLILALWISGYTIAFDCFPLRFRLEESRSNNSLARRNEEQTLEQTEITSVFDSSRKSYKAMILENG